MAKLIVCSMLAVFCGLLQFSAAVPVTTVAPDPGFQQTVAEALHASLQKTQRVLSDTTVALGTINNDFGPGAAANSFIINTLPMAGDVLTADDIEASTLEDQVVLQTLKSQLHNFERHLHAVKLDEERLLAEDDTQERQDVLSTVANIFTKTGELQISLANTATVMGHQFDDTNEDVVPATLTSEYTMKLRACVVFRDYETFLGHMADVFAQLKERESTIP